MSRRATAEVLEAFEEAQDRRGKGGRSRAFDHGELAPVLVLPKTKAAKKREREEKLKARRYKERAAYAKLKTDPVAYAAAREKARVYSRAWAKANPIRIAEHRARQIERDALPERREAVRQRRAEHNRKQRAKEKLRRAADPKRAARLKATEKARQEKFRKARKADPVRWAARLAYMREWNKAKRARRGEAPPPKDPVGAWRSAPSREMTLGELRVATARARERLQRVLRADPPQKAEATRLVRLIRSHTAAIALLKGTR